MKKLPNPLTPILYVLQEPQPLYKAFDMQYSGSEQEWYAQYTTSNFLSQVHYDITENNDMHFSPVRISSREFLFQKT